MRPEKISRPKQMALKVMEIASAFQSAPSRLRFFQLEKMWNPESSVAM